MIRIVASVHRNLSSKQCAQLSFVRAFSSQDQNKSNDPATASLQASAVLNRLRQRKLAQKKEAVDLIQALPANEAMLTKNNINEIYTILSAKSPINPRVLAHDRFMNLIRSTKIVLPKLSVQENTDILKKIIGAEVPMEDELCEVVVKALLPRISLISIDDIIALDFLLRKTWGIDNLSTSFETLRLTMRTIFALKASDKLNEKLSYEQLMKMVRYLSNNTSISNTFGLERLAAQLLLIDDGMFQHKDVICVIVTLARCMKLDADSEQLLTKMYRVWCKNANSAVHVIDLLKLIVEKKRENIELTPFNDEEFVDYCVRITKFGNIENCFEVLDNFNELGLTSNKMIDELSSVYNYTRGANKLNAHCHAIFCIACDKANHKPKNWSSKVEPLCSNVKFNAYYAVNKWLELATVIRRLGFCNYGFLKNVVRSDHINCYFKDDPRLAELKKAFEAIELKRVDIAQTTPDKTLNGHKSKSDDYDKELKLKTWMTEDLQRMVGAERILTDVRLSDVVTIPVVMKINKQTGVFEKFTSRDVKCGDRHFMIGVIFEGGPASLDNSELIKEKQRLLKQRGWITIMLNEDMWDATIAYKRALKFYKCIEYAMNRRRGS